LFYKDADEESDIDMEQQDEESDEGSYGDEEESEEEIKQIPIKR